MVILCAEEEDKLIENCFRGSKKIQYQGLQKEQQNEVVYSNFLHTIYISTTWLSLLFKQFRKSRRSKQKSEDD